MATKEIWVLIPCTVFERHLVILLWSARSGQFVVHTNDASIVKSTVAIFRGVGLFK